LRRLDRDLLADDGARERREGVAAAAERQALKAADQPAHHGVALGEFGGGLLPVGGNIHSGEILNHAARRQPSVVSHHAVSLATRATGAAQAGTIEVAMSASTHSVDVPLV
jgi:hypothetical protein